MSAQPSSTGTQADPDLLSLLRQADHDRYLAALLSPPAQQPALVALYAFNAEIARIRDVVREPMPGEIRLQWWRDALSGDSPDAAAHPVARALTDAIARHDLPKGAFFNYLDARTFDLYDDPMLDRTTLEAYAGETSSALLQLGAMVADRDQAADCAPVAGHAGIAQLIAGLCLLLPLHTARGQLYLPLDLLNACGLDREGFLHGREVDKVRASLDAFMALGRDHLALARAAMPAITRPLRPIFAPVALAQQTFDVMAKSKAADPRTAMIRVAPLRRQWRLWSAARTGRF
jgi:15-cis-phytoene synthase